ncbi:zf-H2C2 2 domain containing protein, partial [Asbolus verrucosus]
VEENDGLPNVVCSNCEEKLNFVIDFRTLILNSDYELRIEKKHEKDEFLVPDPLLIPKQELNGADLEEENIHKEVKKKRDRKRHLKLFPCTECEKAFRYKHELLEHSSIHTGNVPFICDICNKGFINRSLFNKHKLVHSESRPFACNDCGKTYKHQSGLFLHNKGHHSQSVFQCETCEKAFKQRSMLKEHRRVHTGEKPYVCEFCSKEFSFSSTFGHHLKRHAHKKEPAVPCLTCGKMYSRDKLKQHLKTHSGEKPVSCGICSKKFSVNTSLRVHMRIHEGVKPYSCKISTYIHNY